MQELLLGAAYYAEYMPYERTEKDLEMMRNAGINVIRIAESTWSTWEPRDGEFDFSILIKTLELCDRMGMNVIIGTPTYAVPAWLVKKDPKVLLTDKNGRKRYGRRQIMDIMNPTYRMHAERMIRKLCEVTRNYDCVIGYQLDNETKHYGTAGKHVQRLFKAYLQELFGTAEAMNREFGFAYWSNAVADWDDLPDVRGTINGSFASEFEYFQRKLAAEFLMWQRTIVDEYRREGQFVTHNLDFYWKPDPKKSSHGYSYGVQPGINHWEASDALTVCGVDIYHPTQEYLTGMEIAYGGDSIRALKGERYLVLETEAQAYPNWTPFPGQLYLQALSHLASGAEMVEYWNWHSIHNAEETYWKGILSHDLEENRIYREVRTIAESFRKLSPYLKGFRKRNRIALITDNRALTALDYFPVAEGVKYNDILLDFYNALYEQNMECDVVDAQAVTDSPSSLAEYDVVITPALYTASDLLIEELRSFVGQGGTLISSFKSFFTDPHVKVRAARQPYGLTDVFGMSYQEFTVPGITTVRGLPVRGFMELVMPDGAEVVERYEHPYWKDYAAVTKNAFGKGSAWYIGGYVAVDVLKDVLKKAAAPEASDWKMEDGSEACWPVIVRRGVNDAGQEICFVLNYSMEEQRVVCPAEAVDLISGSKYAAGSAVALKPWDALVLCTTGA